MAPVNKSLESGAWTQSIIWSPRAPFRDFTQIEFNNGDDIIPEERSSGSYLSSRTLIVPHFPTSPGSQT
jgi:transcription initiation factor TFIID subunit 1